ncbi:cytidylyltransferase family protein [Diaporthe amygdali]|uniref:cytidylyltransferase family protein n=1 Tax=Phomopsis amygdali TaxID=1214568 RepID=UPI0022FEE50F|nr:cytidylyltransferase family protein [Diaporthe amygdali]KAJ0120959.1 cytidylyltransferase family protein [Diaporthe amygdali]
MASEAAGDAAMTLPRLQNALRSFQSSGRPFQLIQQNASTTSSSGAAAARRCRTLIVLDSSFNPPTLAHMQMATSALQDLRTQQSIAATLKGGSSGQRRGLPDDVRLLLLLAVNNADKAPKPATFEERLLMMGEFAGDVQRAWRTLARETVRQEEDSHAGEEAATLPVDIGLTTLPYFHDKSAAIATSPEYHFPASETDSNEGEPHTDQIFLAGYDTLIRIFNPKYYKSPVPEAAVDLPKPGKTPMQIALDPFFARAQLRITMRTDDEWGGREDQLDYVESIMHGSELEDVGGRREWARRVELVEGTSGEGPEKAAVSSTLAREAVKSKDWDRLRELVPGGVASLIEKGEVAW